MTVRNERIRVLAEIGLTIALAAVLNMAKIWHMPMGGTVSFVLLPLIVLALRRGPAIGLLAGLLYGFVDFFIDFQPPITWAQPLLDYPVAYGLVFLAGLASPAWKRAVVDGNKRRAAWWVLVACLLAIPGRYAAHTLSGIIFFAQYAEWQPVWAYSAVYNLYVPISGALAAIVALPLMPTLERAIPSVVRPTESSPVEGRMESKQPLDASEA